jgi:hypothetical protein
MCCAQTLSTGIPLARKEDKSKQAKEVLNLFKVSPKKAGGTVFRIK